MPLSQAARLLGVSVDASEDEVRKAFRALSRANHPDYGRTPAEVEQRTAKVVQINLANDAFEKHFEQKKLPPPLPEGAVDIMGALRGRPASRQRVQPVVARPYRPGQVDWAARVPRWAETLNSAVIGIRSDGQVDLLVNNTYITTLSSILGVVEHLKHIIGAQPGAGPTAWERYIVYLALQSSGQITTVGLRRLWERVMFAEGESTHAPDLSETERMKPDDFS